ncbi:SigE family RNA polymerase sigma factor [Streptomyces sp. NPDC006879]|uniref:SigE family RNA polymerase sigma factor n=1 Tax=Streptomyces sp. NPDC006879 TaxID=3364767 RepID=UPI0036B73218
MAEVLELAVIPVRTPLVPALPRSRRAGAGAVSAPTPALRPTSGTASSVCQEQVEGGLMTAPGRLGVTRTGTSGAGGANGADAVAGTTVDHLTATYRQHYRSLLGLAALLLDDTASCEDVVQEAFIRVHSARNRVRDPEKTLAYLRQTVVNLSRSALRRRILGLKLLSKPMPDMASAEEGAYDLLEREELIKAMRGIQRRQREVLVLRYFADMTEAQVAETLGISLGSVKAYGSRGIAALRVAMEASS